MFRALWLTAVLVMSISLLPTLGRAEEAAAPAASDTAASSPPADSSSTPDAATPGTPAKPIEAPASPAADVVAMPEPAPVVPPALKPITITFSGDLTAVNAGGTPASITVQDRYGVKKEISVPGEAKVTQGTAAKALSDLKAGDKLTVEYTYDVATGKRTAQNISLGEAAPATN